VFGYPFIEPPKPTLQLPSYLPRTPEGFTRTAVSCVRCGDRCDPDVDDVAKFLKIHGLHIREFLETHNTGQKPVWRHRR
jgi:hypothetical protein